MMMKKIFSVVGTLSFHVLIFSLVLSVLTIQSCTTSRYILSKDDPARIPSKLKSSDVGKEITVTLFEQEAEHKGNLVDYTDNDLMISEEQNQDTMQISFENIEKISLKEKEVPGPFFLLVIGLAFLVYQFGQEMKDLPGSN